RETNVREFIRNYENGKYENPSKKTMIEAGWHDWFCEDEELKPRLDELFPKVKQIAQSPKINIDTMYVLFKNNCPGVGDIYDDFRFCKMRNDDVVYAVVPSSGHKRDKGLAEVWGEENDFQRALAKGYWHDIEEFFELDKSKKTSRVKVGRHINGITLNGYEWLLTEENGDIMYFDTEEQAKSFLLEHGETEEGLEWYKFQSEEVSA
ncbi:MAG: hypothetical protein LBH43_21215, partial [Treponema sp.]|nr:hypothetical protein [Treponema sp.]